MKSPAKLRNRMAGFTLVETMIALLILTIVMFGVFRTISKTQTYYGVEGTKVDFAQQQREFIDQFTRDLHQAGFPTATSLGPANAGLAAQGLTALTQASLTMSGDINGTGQAQTVTYAYNAACNCLQRTVNGGAAITGVDNMLPPGAAGIFTGYDSTGTALGFPIATLNSVRSIRITFTVQGTRDSNNSTLIQTTMTGMARLPNND